MTYVGAPDYRHVSYGEHCVREIMPFPSGTTVLFENFNNPQITWNVETSGGGTLSISTYQAFMGQSSLKLACGSASTYYTVAYKDIGLTRTKRVGFECVYQMPLTKGSYIKFHIGWNDGTTWYKGWIRYNIVNQKWQVMTTGDTWQDITDGSQTLRLGPGHWHKFKMIVDYAEQKHVVAWSDDKELNTAGVVVDTDVSSVYNTLGVGVEVAATDSTMPAFYVDQILITEEKV